MLTSIDTSNYLLIKLPNIFLSGFIDYMRSLDSMFGRSGILQWLRNQQNSILQTHKKKL